MSRKTVLFALRLAPDIYALIDKLRAKESDMPSRAEMVRRLIERAAK